MNTSRGVPDMRSSTLQLAQGGASRARLYESVVGGIDTGIPQEEIEIHFDHMPVRYWSRTDANAVRWHLKSVHEFLRQVADPVASGTSPVVRWRHFPNRGLTELLVCTWDRLGLLAKVAGALAEVGLNIVRAEIFTRGDSVVLDVFQVSDETQQHIHNESRLKEAARILNMALAVDREPALPTTEYDLAETLRKCQEANIAGDLPVVHIDNDRSDTYTILEIEARDRIGLLYVIFRVLAEHQVNVAQAIVTTESGVAGDIFYLTDVNEFKIHDRDQLARIRNDLAVVASE